VPVRLQPGLPPQLRHVVVRDRHALGAFDERGEPPARSVRQARLCRRTGPRQRQHPTPNRGRHLLPRCARRRSCNPDTPPAAKRDSHRSTVGRDTPANAATSTFGRPSARHNTIRARVATDTDTSALRTSAANSARCSDVNSTHPANPAANQTSVKKTGSRNTRHPRGYQRLAWASASEPATQAASARPL
jgi:hypothetical protein